MEKKKEEWIVLPVPKSEINRTDLQPESELRRLRKNIAKSSVLI